MENALVLQRPVEHGRKMLNVLNTHHTFGKIPGKWSLVSKLQKAQGMFYTYRIKILGEIYLNILYEPQSEQDSSTYMIWIEFPFAKNLLSFGLNAEVANGLEPLSIRFNELKRNYNFF